MEMGSVENPDVPVSVLDIYNYLSNNIAMPVLGVTSWLNDETVSTKILEAILNGFRQIEVSTVYQNERNIGEGIAKAVNAKIVQREQLFIVLKIWLHDLNPVDIQKTIIKSIAAMKLKTVDMVVAHIPSNCNSLSGHDIRKIWRQLHKVYTDKLTRSIGVANWTEEQIEVAIGLKLTAVHLSQKELGLYSKNFAHWQLCSNYRIIFSHFATLGSPGELNYTISSERKSDWTLVPDDEAKKAILKASEELGETPRTVMLNFAIYKGFVSEPRTPTHLANEFFPTVSKFTGGLLFLLKSSGAFQTLFIRNSFTKFAEDLHDAIWHDKYRKQLWKS